MQPTEIMRATEPIGSIGAAFYFHPDTLAVGKAAGLDGFRFYALGRGGVLGDVEPGVVHAAFGYFNTGLIDKIWNGAKQVMAPRDGARLYLECAHRLGRAKFSEIDGLDGFVEAATQIIGAVEGASMPLFAGVRAEPVPDDAPGCGDAPGDGAARTTRQRSPLGADGLWGFDPGGALDQASRGCGDVRL